MASVENRITALEVDVAFLKQQLSTASRNENWWDHIAGSFRDEPEFEEVLRLGREIRQQESRDGNNDD